MHAGTDSAAGAESEVVALRAVGVGSGVVEAEGVGFVADRVEGAWGGGADGVHVDSPDVVHDAGAGGDEVAFVSVGVGGSVGDAAEDGRWAPACFRMSNVNWNDVMFAYAESPS